MASDSVGGNMEAVDAWINALISLGKRQDNAKLGKILRNWRLMMAPASLQPC